jgi:hypothetical protein
MSNIRRSSAWCSEFGPIEAALFTVGSSYGSYTASYGMNSRLHENPLASPFAFRTEALQVLTLALFGPQLRTFKL